jgi:hypothetical protein
MSEGLKHDKGKLRYDLIQVETIEELAKVFAFGSAKYGDNTWQKVEPFRDRYFAALMRHLIAWRKGETKDDESGLKHLSHALWNVAALLWHETEQDVK